jgi:protein TonB
MVPRRIAACIATLILLLLADPSASRDSASPAVRDWLSTFITKIDEADRARPPRVGYEPAGTVVVHVEVGADGLVRQAQIERGSGSTTLDRRALDAVRAVSPFTAPPAELLTEAGVTDLSFPIRLGR